MAITVKHNKVSTIPDTDDTSLVRPSDWNADHTLVGTIDVANGGTGASTLTGYVKGNGTSAMTAVATVPSTDITGLGTMSTQNANAVAITGGTINGTTIGATIPSSVNATTITGQTGVLRGTGQNFLPRSQEFDNGWTLEQVTVTANSVVAPDSTTTADTITATAVLGTHLLARALGFSIVSGITYTISIFAKKNTNNFLQITTFSGVNALGSGRANFNISTGVVGTVDGGTSAITDAGNGWYRCSYTITASASGSASIYFGLITSSSAGRFETFTAAGTESFYLWGSQFEFGSTANTYIPTTTTAVYGTPTLSFSGVSTIGLESNGSLFVQPAGTGAIQAQATTSTTAGGNARGTVAVDWQMNRGSAGQVASGAYSVVGGGGYNTASGTVSTVSGGYVNTSSAYGSVIAGGQNNTASSTWASIVGGKINSALGFFNFIGAGFTNSGTASAAVTTQSGTMNATTAVTLSGSNANIKVGQYITGTSIGDDTYVAAISGTALTLSKNASGSSTSTLSFFTPHGVVVGGGNNQATGSYSFIGGGGDAGTAANRNTASGDWSFVGGGQANTASGIGAVVAGGGTTGSAIQGNTASGISASVVGGVSNVASGNYSFVGNGAVNTANSTAGAVVAGYRGTTRSIQGNLVFPASITPIANTSGVSQAALLVLARETTDATPTALCSNTSAAGTTNQVILPNNSAYLFKATVISNVTGGGNTSAWKLEGAIKRGANAASTTIVGLVTTTLLAQDAGAATWAIAATADTTNGGLRITFTGQASTTIRTVCKVETTEVTF